MDYDTPGSNPIQPQVPASQGSSTSTQNIAVYAKWNQWLVTGAFLAQTIDTVLTKAIQDPAASRAVDAACHAFYDAAQGMNRAIIVTLKGLQAQPPAVPAIDFPSIDLPEWPATPNLFSLTWETATPALELLAQKLALSQPGSAMDACLAGLMDAGEKLVATLSVHYPQWGTSGNKPA
jgi:phage tail protein X